MLARRLILFALLLPLLLAGQAQDTAPAAHTVAFDGVGFAFSERIATGIEITQVAAVDGETPPHLLFTFVDYVPEATVTGERRITRQNFHAPVIRVYKTADLLDYGLDDKTYYDEANTLAEMIVAQPDLTAEDELPFLPLMPGIQTLHAREKVIASESVVGLAYLTHRADRPGIILEGRVFYTFQGLSADAAYTIAAWLPVDSGVLPAAFTMKSDFDQILEHYDLYTAARIVALTTQPDDAYYPPLADLDALFNSFTVSPTP